MLNIVNLLSQAFSTTGTTALAPVKSSVVTQSGNPFVSYKGNSISYAKNAPVRGGYFAGYHNGKQNIVGQRLFIEV